MTAKVLGPVPREWLNITEAAQYVRSRPENIRELINLGLIDTYEKVVNSLHPENHVARTRRVLIARTDLDAYMRSTPAREVR